MIAQNNFMVINEDANYDSCYSTHTGKYNYYHSIIST